MANKRTLPHSSCAMQTLTAHCSLIFTALTHFQPRVILKFSPGGGRGGAVVLSTESQINLDAVKAICSLPDDLYRLRWVSYAYYDIHRRLAKKFGANASWPAFARWSAYTISEALRLDQVNPRLEEALREHSLPERVTGPLVAIQKQLRSLDDGAMPTVLASGTASCSTRLLTRWSASWIGSRPRRKKTPAIGSGTRPASHPSNRRTSSERATSSGCATE